MANAISDEAIDRGTGKPWSEWVSYLESIDARSMTHKEIAQHLNGDAEVDGWWAQTLTVEYEQQLGRRVAGQDCGGTFSVSVSKTLRGDMDSVLAWWVDAVRGMDAFSDVPLTQPPETSQSEKWRYWRAALADGSRASAHISEKSDGKSTFTIQHDKIESLEQREHWRSFWRTFVDDAACNR